MEKVHPASQAWCVFWAGTFLLREGGEVSGFDFEWFFLLIHFWGVGWGGKTERKIWSNKVLDKIEAKGFLSATLATERTMEKVVQNLGQPFPIEVEQFVNE